MASLETEAALLERLPDGFDTTLVEEDRLRQLNDADRSVLGDVVDDYGNFTLNEEQIIQAEIERTLTAFQTDDRTLEFPGTAIEFDHLLDFAAYYKGDNDTPSGTIKDARRAGPDDIVFSFANPEVYGEISGNTINTYNIEGATGGSRVEVVGDAGLNEAGNTNGNSLTLDDDEMLFFTGDYIDLSSGQSIVSKIQWEDVDGESYGPDDGILQGRLSSTHILTAQGAWVKSTADLDAKAYEDGNAELVPIAFYMAPGTKAPTLV